MRKTLTVALLAVLLPAISLAATATVTFTSAKDRGTCPATVKCDPKTITVDLSALGSDAQIARAVLRPAGDIANQVYSSAFKTPPPVTVTAGKDDKPLPLAPPRYVSFDATAPVAQAIKAGEKKVVFTVVSLPGFNGEAALEVTCDGKIKPKAKVPAASGLCVQHRAGQTFVTFTDPDPAIQGEITLKEFKELKARFAAAAPKTTFRIYKHAEPITAANIGRAVLADEVGRLTCWNGDYMGVNLSLHGNSKAVRYAIEDEKPLPPDAGLCVLNPDKAGKAYYAVSVAIDGEEDFATINAGNATGTAVEETVGTGEPVLQRVHKLGKSEFLFCVEDATLHFYTRWEAPPNGNHSDNPIDYLVGIPPKVARPAPVFLHMHFMGGNMFGGGFWTNYAKGWIAVSSNQYPYDWWTGYHECTGTWRSWADGAVHDYTQTRLISFIDWLDGKWKIDKTRVAVEGGSMGGAGTTNLAMHRADRFAFAAGEVGIHVPANSNFANSYAASYGSVEWRLPFQDRKTAAFDYFSNVWYLKNHVTESMPLVVFSNGKNDTVMGWPQALDFFRAMQETRQPHIFFWGLSGHGQGLSLPGERVADGAHRTLGMDIRTDRTLPAFTRCSLDGNPGTAKAIPQEEFEKLKAAAKKEKEEKKQQNERAVDPYDGDSIGQANAYLYWETDDALIVDEPNRWGLTLALVAKAPKDECVVDVTPRRCQKFVAKPGEKFQWTSKPTGANKPVQLGEATADQYGLVTIPAVIVTKSKSRLSIEKK
jgi:pimeloyl-ACP methyl ester carboxylesterase